MYTGSCASQICFRGSDSNKTAEILRYTHRGPGTVILVDNTEGSQNGTTNSTDVDNPGDLSQVLLGGADNCDYQDQGLLQYATSTTCATSPLGDGREEARDKVQCRVACKFFDFSPYEVVRLATRCAFCSSDGAEEWFTQNSGQQPRVCIPRETCIERCGPEGYGCVYTGSCETRICFSGIDSKRPAVFTTLSDDGKDSELSVDNSGGPKNSDPPVFGSLRGKGNATSVPPAEDSPAPADIPKPSASGLQPIEESPAPNNSPGSLTSSPVPAQESLTPESSPQPPSSTFSNSSASSGQSTVWVWLGPVIGVVMVGAVIAAGLVAIVLRKRKAQELDSTPEPIHTLFSMTHTGPSHPAPYSLPTPTTPVLTTPPLLAER